MTKPARDHRGANNPNAVLTPLLVGEVRRLHEVGFGYGFIATWLDVTKSCVQAVVTGRTWRRPGQPRRRVKKTLNRRSSPTSTLSRHNPSGST